MIDNRQTDASVRNLTQLLYHLDRQVADPKRTDSNDDELALPLSSHVLSSFERQKLRANFEHARALLLRLEHDSTSINVASRKRAVQADLRGKREQIKKLQLRIQELDDASESESDEDDSVVSDEDHHVRQADVTEQVVSGESPGKSAQQTSSLKRRVGANDSENTAAYSTGISNSNKNASKDTDDIQSREKTLTTDRREQEQIMEELLSLTRQLKSSASVFQGSLENEKSLLDKAATGLDRNVDGMDAAGKRMGTLRRMTEGKGFFARLKLYGFIAVLWLVALLLVFVLPKLRF